MKRFITLLICSLFLINIFGQNQNKNSRFNCPIKPKELKTHDYKLFNISPKQFWDYEKQNELFKSSQDIKQRLDSNIQQYWIETTSLLDIKYKYEFVYDSNKNCTQWFIFEHNGATSNWENEYKKEYIYNINGKISQNINYNWEENSNEWIPNYNIDYTYNIEGILILALGFNWDNTNSTWINNHKNEYAYNLNWDRSQTISYDWEESLNDWIVDCKEDYSYDENNNNIQIIVYDWDELNNLWINDYKYEFTFDTNGNFVQEIFYWWDEANNAWVVEGKREFTIDEYGNLAEQINYSWNQSGNVWIESYKAEYNYNNSYSLEDLIIPLIYGDNDMINAPRFWNHMLTNHLSYEWDDINYSWILYQTTTYYYSEQNITFITDKINNTELIIYPNPFSHSLSFNISNQLFNSLFELFDFHGHSIFQKEVRSGETLKVERLESGIYYYEIFINGKQFNGKLIKK